MLILQRCNYGGPLGQPIPTRSRAATLAASFGARLRRLTSLPRRRR